MWCHTRLVNPHGRNAERLKKEIKKIAAKLSYSYIIFPLNINDYEIIEDIFNLNVNNFGYENKVYPLYISKNPILKYLVYC